LQQRTYDVVIIGGGIYGACVAWDASLRGLTSATPLIKQAFNLDYIRRLMREHQEYRANHNHILWALINLAIWHRLFIETRVSV
jgi:glycine/D-amino acid oxidase-like deaminating enzyme